MSPGRYDVTLYLMAPALDGPGNVVMDVKAEEDVVFDDLDITTEAGGEYQALVKTFAVDVTDGTLDLRFRVENKAAVASAIAVTAQTTSRPSERRQSPKGVMTALKFPRLVLRCLPFILVAAHQQDGQASDVITLVSPNEQENGGFGISVAGAGDVDRDGFADLIVGGLDSPDTGGTGRGYVFSGRSGDLVLELTSPNEQPGGGFGEVVSGAGDVNGDGVPDLMVGAVFENDFRGRVYIFNGEDGSLLWELTSPNAEEGGKFGLSVAGAGDVDQDGLADVLVGAPLEDPGPSPTGAGRAYVFSGRTGGLLFEFVSPTESESGDFGRSVAGAGDIDLDGFADLIVGSFIPGRIYVFSGQDGSLLLELTQGGSVAVAGAGDVEPGRGPGCNWRWSICPCTKSRCVQWPGWQSALRARLAPCWLWRLCGRRG